MCGSQGSNLDCCCCPNRVVFQEKICGNLTGPLPVSGTTSFVAWVAPAVNDYFQGTFEIFNAGPAGTISAEVIDTSGTIFPIVATPGNSISVSVNNPASLTIISVPLGTSGTFCINLYKSIFA
ncbi:hypothetical protein AXI59_16240 [Bacillus nakamurai]|uniref:Endospore appendages core domain-containing protein n=1 Tax=Bacillus nakamurai TaxID=1793963 RepID=A0A150F3U6_9BACI|nr:S-Ena type endospore appendage [Bacillus nakamurai]KXZ12711.1 hypothetical protein AXI58_06250 [Bacillus nakamurai]KXZ18807.1 hypothetical protein AXI59_16240 [Bacillus nakamurai]